MSQYYRLVFMVKEIMCVYVCTNVCRERHGKHTHVHIHI